MKLYGEPKMFKSLLTKNLSENCVKDDDLIPNGYISGPGVLKTGDLWDSK